MIVRSIFWSGGVVERYGETEHLRRPKPALPLRFSFQTHLTALRACSNVVERQNVIDHGSCGSIRGFRAFSCALRGNNSD